jgi:hypothetical protein
VLAGVVRDPDRARRAPVGGQLDDACGDGGRGGVQGEYKLSAATLPGRPTVIASSRTLCRSRPA